MKLGDLVKHPLSSVVGLVIAISKPTVTSPFRLIKVRRALSGKIEEILERSLEIVSTTTKKGDSNE